MTDHPEIEQLSAHVDGELSAAEVAQLETHLPGCAECTRTLAAIRSTVDDLALLTDPVLDASTIAAIDRSIAAERQTRRSFARRWGLVSSAAAAALVALLVFAGVVRNGSEDETTTELRSARGTSQGVLDASVIDYTEESLATALTAYGAPAVDSVGVAPALSSGGGTGGEASPTGEAYASREATKLTGSSNQFARCKQQIESADANKTSVRGEIARFKGQPAFVLFYTRPRENPTHAEVWVLRPDDCYTLYFAQARI